ncbi:CARDB domain-containing protein, partial [Candidatus Omnitrophota bacterium]
MKLMKYAIYFLCLSSMAICTSDVFSENDEISNVSDNTHIKTFKSRPVVVQGSGMVRIGGGQINAEPDLVIKRVTLKDTRIPYMGKLDGTYTIKNIGSAAISGSIVCSIDTLPPLSSMGFLRIGDGLKPGEEKRKSFSFDSRKDWKPDKYRLSITADSNRNITESDEFNNTSKDIQFEIYEKKPDIIIKKIWMDKNKFAYGEKIKLHYNVKNIGQANYGLDIYCGKDLIPRCPMGPLSISGGLNASEERISWFTLQKDTGLRTNKSESWKPGRYSLTMVADHQNKIDESNENNNKSNVLQFDILEPPKPKPKLKPDLVINKISINNANILHGSTGTKITYTIKNEGKGAVTGPITCSMNSTPSFTTGYLRVDGGLKPGQEKTSSFPLTDWKNMKAGKYRLSITADSKRAIDESNEKNNTSKDIQFQIYKKKPDII